MTDFITKDSGKRAQLAGGMVRDTEEGKTNFLLVFSGVMFERWAGVLTRGAVKYNEDNWLLATKATNPVARAETKRRFLKSAARHFVQWIFGQTDEDHAAAVFFNINGYETMKATDAEAAEAKRLEDQNGAAP